jgi:phosphodiesterase/alkaline phosphatase D-like protein
MVGGIALAVLPRAEQQLRTIDAGVANPLFGVRRVRNVVWLTADVHYCAAHY